MSNEKKSAAPVADPAENNEQLQTNSPAGIAENGDVADKNGPDTLEYVENNENEGISYAFDITSTVAEEPTVTIYQWQLDKLVELNQELKGDIITLVNVFRMFAGITTNPLKIVGAVSKIMADDDAKARLNVAIQLIEKYTENNG